MTITFFALAILFQAAAVLYSLRMAVFSNRRAAWILLTLGFGAMLYFRIVRAYLSHTNPEPDHDWTDAFASVLVSSFLFSAMILIKLVYDARDAAEKKLRESENRYRSVVTSLGEGIVIVDEDSVKACNPAAEKILGVPHDELIKRKRCDLLWHAFREDGSPLAFEDRPASRTFRTGVPHQNITVGVERPDGAKVWLSMNSEPLATDPESEKPLVVISFLDITARKLVEEDLRKAKDAAEAASAAKDRFLAVLSHELRTPLAPVLATIDAMAMDPALPENFEKDIQLLRRNVELEARLIDDLLDLTRVSKGKLQLNTVPVDLHEVLGHVLEICATDIAAKNLHVATYLSADKHTVPGDSARLQQVLWNLLKNAIKFTPQHGRITIRSSTRIVRACSATITLEVTDSGVGIESAAIPGLFNAFQQANPSITRQFGGLGLGLAITKALVELHRGRVTATSPGPGQGASFFVELPLLVRPAIGGDPTPDPGTGKSRPLAILLVEDHPDTRGTMTRLLTTLGHSVKAAASVKEALAAAHQDFDLILSDISLPDGSGLELLQQIRRTRNIPAIALSGYGMEEDIAKSKDAGFMAHLTKPITIDALERALQQAATPAKTPVPA